MISHLEHVITSDNYAKDIRELTKKLLSQLVKKLHMLEPNSTELSKECMLRLVTFQKFFVSKIQFIIQLTNMLFLLFIAKGGKGFSVFGGEFADESFSVGHNEPGLLGMCKRNGIPDTNEC